MNLLILSESGEIKRLPDQFQVSARIYDEAKQLGLNVVIESFLNLECNFDDKLLIDIKGKNLKEFDIVIIREASHLKYQKSILGLVANYLSNSQTYLLNSTSIIKYPNNYNKIIQYTQFLKNNIPIPKSFFSMNLDNTFKFFNENYLIKPSKGSLGTGIYLINELQTQMDTFKQTHITDEYIVQKRINNNHDLRIIVIGDKAYGAMKKTMSNGSIVSNFAAVGLISHVKLTDKISELALKAVKAVNLEYGGVDIMLDKETNKPFILEVNRNAFFEGFEKSTKINVAKELLKYLIEKAEKLKASIE